MESEVPSSLPQPHRSFLLGVVERLQRDARLVGVAAGGSYLTNSMDEHSDLDLVIAVEPADYEAVLRARTTIAGSLGQLLAAFTGEHVGEPRLLVCLYGEPLLHVDLKFVSLEDIADRVEDPAILWQRSGRISDALEGTAYYPTPDAAWIEARFWTWVHYGATKIARGELFEALSLLGYLRSEVLGPLGLLRAGARPSGVRRVERLAPDLAAKLALTVASHDARSCAQALRATVDLYRSLRQAPPAQPSAEIAAVRFLDGLL
ncbi:MAG TPA: nucleotidyltransferase domain-containing protein [Polyangiaceae bacterium]